VKFGVVILAVGVVMGEVGYGDGCSFGVVMGALGVVMSALGVVMGAVMW
jgi:hypothetical protein